MMRREDLRVVLPGNKGARATSVTAPVSDSEFAELIESMGYVKADAESYVNEVMRLAKKYGWFRPLGSTQGSFRAAAPNGEIWEVPERVLVSAGWVKVPDCEACKGTRIDPESYVPATHLQPSEADPCPSCGGTGKQRMVALPPVIFDAIRRHYEIESYEHPDGWQRAPKTETMVKYRDIFAALEGGDPE